jgi:hypothetical protein
LKGILDQIIEGKIQLPDFQRGWVWDDEHIRSLLVSIARDFPIGSIMLLETGGQAKFQIRPIEGVNLNVNGQQAEKLILDGQQRLTSLTQVLRFNKPVQTKDSQNRAVERHYYINIDKALAGNSGLEDAIIGVDSSKTLRKNFGRDIELDLSTQEKEFARFYFPFSQALNSDYWEEGLMAYDQNKFALYMKFRSQVLNKFREYLIPVIELKKENTKEAVCLVFEKVNTGGVPLSVFDLMTASYAADGFNLRDDWYGSAEKKIEGRKKQLSMRPLLSGIEPTDYLQGISLLYSYERRLQDLAAGKNARDMTAVSAKREQVLGLPLSAYQQWADKLMEGFRAADRFLRKEGFRSTRYLPYRTQLVPLACIMVRLGDRWMEPVIYDKIARWFWCGVFGELYGGAVETRIALDLQDLLAWVDQAGIPEPATVVAAGFQPSRLDTLRTRTSAAYRGLYVLLQREGSKDFFWKTPMADLDVAEYEQCIIDIHHIFPTDWCRKQGIPDNVSNAVVNKTAISYKANRMILGKAPSSYLDQLRTHKQVQITQSEQDAILRTHLIEPALLRADNFQQFYEQRKLALIKLVEKAMGKTLVTASAEPPPDDAIEDEPGE